ncbi:MAG: right-handed parallel beta-helix repeat-containing protein [Candidatus Hodarchaeales archaeon]
MFFQLSRLIKNHKNYKNIIFILMLFTLFSSIVVSNITNEKSTDKINNKNLDSFDRKVDNNLIDHIPILLENNTAFHQQAIIEEWYGDGTKENPYIIEDYNIVNVSDNSSAIRVVNTTLSFIVRNIIIDETAPGSYGMHFNSITGEIQIVNNKVLKARLASIYIVNSTKLVLKDNNLVQGYNDGLFINNSQGIIILNNSIGSFNPYWPNYGTGLSCIACNQSQIINNTLIRNTKNGLVLESSHGVLIHNNTIKQNTIESTDYNAFFGFILFNSENLTVSNNRINSNYALDSFHSNGGITLVNISYSLIYHNFVSDHMRLAIYLINCNNVTVYLNEFTENAFQYLEFGINSVGLDDSCCENNSWSYDGLGNYWDNYVGNDNDGDGIGEIEDAYVLKAPNGLVGNAPKWIKDYYIEVQWSMLIDSETFDKYPIMSPLYLEFFYTGINPFDSTSTSSLTTSTSSSISSNQNNNDKTNSSGFEMTIMFLSMVIFVIMRLLMKRTKND